MATMILLDLMGAVALLLWGLHMVRTGIIRAFDSSLRRVLATALRNRFTAFLALRELPGFASACSPKSHGRICEGTTARLDLSLDPNARPLLREPRARRHHGAQRNKHAKPDSLGHAHGSLLTCIMRQPTVWPQYEAFASTGNNHEFLNWSRRWYLVAGEPTQNFCRPRAVGSIRLGSIGSFPPSRPVRFAKLDGGIFAIEGLPYVKVQARTPLI